MPETRNQLIMKSATGSASSATSNGARSRWGTSCTKRIGTPPRRLFLRKVAALLGMPMATTDRDETP
jgi:hypothetical protein